MVVLFSAGNSDSRVLVRGFGGVGMAASICLRKLGVREIFVDDISIERKEKSSAMGFSLLDSGAREESFTEIFDATGSISSIENSLAMLSAPGTLVFASHPPSGEKISIDPFELIRGKKIFGTWGGGINSQTLFDEIVNLLKQEILPEDFLGESFKLKDINRALDYSLSGQIGRALLVCD
jgi:Zn-dependent alcohol dehydrogenase